MSSVRHVLMSLHEVACCKVIKVQQLPMTRLDFSSHLAVIRQLSIAVPAFLYGRMVCFCISVEVFILLVLHATQLQIISIAAGRALSPPKTSLLTQQGGTLLFRDEQTVFRQDDAGILKYTSIADLTAAIANVQQSTIASTSQV